MFVRVDPSRSAGNDFFILDSDASADNLQARDSLVCSAGGHQKLKSAKLITTQDITCSDTGMPLFTIIYSAQ
jgi:hypothetical protein